MNILAGKSRIHLILLLVSMLVMALTPPAFSENQDWFLSLQEVLVSGNDDNTAQLDGVVDMAIKSGVQVYVILQTAVAMDSKAVDKVLKSTTRVTQDPGNVVKAAIIANIEAEQILNAVIPEANDKETAIAACINAGTDINTVISTSLEAGADPATVVSASMAASQNVSGVIEAAVNAKVPPGAILKAAFDQNQKDLGPVVSACVNSGGDPYEITYSAIEMGADSCDIIVSALSSSNNYYQVIKAALDLNISSTEITNCVVNYPFVDQAAVASAIETAEAALAYSPAQANRRQNRRDMMNRDRNRGNVSTY